MMVVQGLVPWVQAEMQADLANGVNPPRSVLELVTTYLGMPADPARPDGPDNAQPLRDVAAASVDTALLTEHLLAGLGSLGAQPVIPPRSCQQPRACDKALYRLRNRIERCFARLKQIGRAHV